MVVVKGQSNSFALLAACFDLSMFVNFQLSVRRNVIGVITVKIVSSHVTVTEIRVTQFPVHVNVDRVTLGHGVNR